MVRTIGGAKLFCQAVIILSLLLGMSGSQAEKSPSLHSKRKLDKDIEKLISDPLLKGTDIGIKVVSLKTNKTVYEHHSTSLLKPASNIKLVLTLAALKYLGPEYTFKTKVYTDGKIRNGVLHGNLYIKGFGDPKFVSEKLWFFTNELKRLGFRQVTGSLILDDSFFDKKRQVRNGVKRYRQRAYDAPLGALSVNFNVTTVYVAPGKRKGSNATVTIDPDNYYVKVINKAKTVGPIGKMTIQVDRVPGKYNDTVKITGNIPLGYKEKRYYRNVSHPLRYAAAMFRRFFREQGIIIKGKNRYKEVPKKAEEMLVYESRPLRIIVSDLNRISNNFVAEQILKTMAAELKERPGTTDKGLEILTDFLKSLGISNGYKLVNGSGLSERNRMSAAQFIEVLKHGYRQFKVFPEYVGSMGIVGVDGTVDVRLKNTVAQGRIRAKTGSLKGVIALSGYLSTLNNEPLAFSILMNDPKKRNMLMQNIQDQILLRLCHLDKS